MRTIVYQRTKKCLDFLMDAQVVAVSPPPPPPLSCGFWCCGVTYVDTHVRTNSSSGMAGSCLEEAGSMLPIYRTPRRHNSENCNMNFDLLQDIKVLLYYLLDESSFRHTETGKLRPRLSTQVFFFKCVLIYLSLCANCKVLSFPPGFRIKIFYAFLRLWILL